MKTIAMICQKGGVGKSTNTTNLAVAFAKSGLNVAVLDLDPQGTSYSWGERRTGENNLVVLSIQAVALQKELRRMAEAGCDIAIIDTRGAGDAAATAAVNAADLVLIPTLPSFPDIEAIGQTLDMTDRAGKPTFVFLNSCSTHKDDKDADNAAAAIAAAGGKVADVRIKDRVSFRRALGAGLSVLEHDSQDTAAMTEIAQLHKFACEQIGL